MNTPLPIPSRTRPLIILVLLVLGLCLCILLDEPYSPVLVANNQLFELKHRNEDEGTQALLHIEEDVRGGKPFQVCGFDIQPKFQWDKATHKVSIQVLVFRTDGPLPRSPVAEAHQTYDEVIFNK
jgi:hypothetical protein